MAHGRNKYQSRENRARVRDVLMREWDPIGVAGVPEAAGEYDTYADKTYTMLIYDRATAEAITAYLVDIATGHKGLSGTDEIAERSACAARILVGMRPEFETH